MIDIHIPFSLKAEVVEIDDHLPSFQIDLNASLDGFSLLGSVNTKMWIRCEEWDRFSEALDDNLAAELLNLDGKPILTIDVNNYEKNIAVTIEKKFGDSRSIDFKIQSPLDEEEYGIIKRQIKDFAKWW